MGPGQVGNWGIKHQTGRKTETTKTTVKAGRSETTPTTTTEGDNNTGTTTRHDLKKKKRMVEVTNIKEYLDKLRVIREQKLLLETRTKTVTVPTQLPLASQDSFQ